KSGKLDMIVTQNIDGLHQLAGNKKVCELHGSVNRNICQECGRMYDLSVVLNSKGIIPHCPHCNGIIKPDVVLYQEPLDENVMVKAMVSISQADLLIVAGTSLVVYPASGFINYFQGKHLVLIDKDVNAKNSHADVIIHQKVGELFSLLKV
ncbi:MAG: Sir2 family NAD-dependent protein deacetylase, partial [Bacilli bacterium]